MIVKRFLSACVLFLFFYAAIPADTFDREIAKTLDEFSRAYLAAHPGMGMKCGLAILELEELSEEAKRNRVGTAVETRLADGLDRSIAFTLVDRKNVGKILKEMELSMSGAVDESTAMKFGEMTGAKAFVSGKITEEQADFRVSLSLTDGEGGTVIASRAFAVPRGELVKIAVDLQYQYVAKYGIGLSGSSFFPVYPFTDLFNKYVPVYASFGALYRPLRYLQAGAGILYSPMNTGESYRFEQDLPSSSLQPGIPDKEESDYWGLTGLETGGVNQVTARFDLMLINADLQYTLNIFPWLNVGFSGGALFVPTNPVMLVSHGSAGHGIFYRQALAENAAPGSEAYYSMPYAESGEFRYLFDNNDAVGFRVELRPEVFLSPRLALYAKAGYMWMPRMKIREIHAPHADWYFYQEGKDSATWEADPEWTPESLDYSLYAGENLASWIYYGLNPTIRPDGIRYGLDLSCIYVQAGMSFYF